jgi:hypothetical protein
MKLQEILEEAEVHLICGWSESRVVDFVLQHAKNDNQANAILNRLFN